MTVGFGAISSREDGGTSDAVHSFSFDAGSGVDRGLVVDVVTLDTGGTPAPATGVTYNSVAMTLGKLITYNYGGSKYVHISSWYLDNPASGSNTVSITLDSTPGGWFVCGARYYTGANNGIGANTASVSGNLSDHEFDNVGTDTDALHIWGNANLGRFFVEGTGFTERYGHDIGIAYQNLYGGDEDATVGTDTVGGTLTDSNGSPNATRSCSVIFELLPAAGGVTHNSGADLTGSATVAAVAEVIHAADAALIGSGTIAADGSQVLVSASSVTGSATIAAVGSILHNSGADLTGSASLVATAEVVHSATATLGASATLSAVASQVLVSAASITGSATVTPTASILGTVYGAADITASATIQAIAEVIHSAIADLTGEAIVAAVGTVTSGVIHNSGADLTGEAIVAATAEVVHSAIADLTGSATVQAIGVLDPVISGSAIQATATITAVGSILGAVTGAADLTGSATVTADPAFILISGSSITGSAIVAAVGTIEAPGAIEGAAILVATATLAAEGVLTVISGADLIGEAEVIAEPDSGLVDRTGVFRALKFHKESSPAEMLRRRLKR